VEHFLIHLALGVAFGIGYAMQRRLVALARLLGSPRQSNSRSSCSWASHQTEGFQ
jgi:hypothetical protein